MKIKIGFQHSKNNINLYFNGKYKVYDCNNDKLVDIENSPLILEFQNPIPAEYDWYEKIDTFYDVSKMESYQEKYFYKNSKVRIIRVGVEIGKFDNFEYWVLKKTVNMDGKIYPSGDFKYKKLIKKESTGTIISNVGISSVKSIRFVPENQNCSFLVKDVPIGIDFHWGHSEELEYEGELKVFVDNKGLLSAVNIIDLESYLISVNSSEMRSDNNIEMLKAQTVAARGTVLATIGKHHFSDGFDLCADDHCQCFQGSKRITEISRIVTSETAGEVLMFDNSFCDTRYSKICGGITEKYSTCWEDMDFSYLPAITDNAEKNMIPIKMSESEAEKFISDKDYDCYCNTNKYKLPESLEFSKDLFRWEEKISLSDIKENINNKFQRDIGDILDIIPIERGNSGRIKVLEVLGTEGKTTISKELNIRRLLSNSHLPSSAFILAKNQDGFTLKGAGWGHGVGLCQIGAQIMGEKGHTYKDILKHYYKGSVLKKLTLV
ncbi:MAG: SpoIID/LytB domain-containing protein [Candidatus Delongbacteria bacterium]|jgi:stage II sporulation protein D|nr:SpoIID/LytB domain-containing protein [Candidatus Delongbacteria bacterium]